MTPSQHRDPRRVTRPKTQAVHQSLPIEEVSRGRTSHLPQRMLS